MKFAQEELRLVTSFILIVAIIVLLGFISLFALNRSQTAVDDVLRHTTLVRLAKQGTINLARAGRLPSTIEKTFGSLEALQDTMQTMRQDLIAIGEEIAAANLSATEQDKAAKLLSSGASFYDALERFVPLRESILQYITEYKGEQRPLFDVLSQRELDHIRYVRALNDSIRQRKLLVGTLQIEDCGFYSWYSEETIPDRDLAEIILEEIDPLHRKLHDYAAQVKDLLDADAPPAAFVNLQQEAESNLALLGRYFAGLRALSHARYTASKESYEDQVQVLEGIYAESVVAANELVDYLQDNSLKNSLAILAKTTATSSGLIWAFAILGSLFTAIITFIAFQHVRQWTSQLTNAYDELKATQSKMLQSEKMASIGQLAAGVAHEINNPMGFISSNLGTLDRYVERLTEFINTQQEIIASLHQSGVLEELKDKRKKMKLDYIFEDTADLIKESLEGADRIKQIVQSLKNFSRIDQADYKLSNINECLETTLNVIWNELKYKTTVTKEYGDLPETYCYPNQLNQVFMNLLINAAQAIDTQGEITIRTWHQEDHIYVWIADTGKGIPEDKIDKIFEPFYTTKDVGKGTGLGLSITYDIIKKHKGHITVDSHIDQGTTFIIRLPVVSEENPDHQA